MRPAYGTLRRSFFPPCREWDPNRLAGGESTLQRMCKSCLLLLSVPTVHREAATHAAAVLVRLALASWRASGRWPRSDLFSSMETVPTAAPAASATAAAAASTATGEVDTAEPHSSVPQQASLRLEGAATVLSKSFFPNRQGQRVGTDGVADGTAALVAGFMPLPSSSSLAVCRALLHIVHPRVLLAACAPEEETAEGRPPAMVTEGCHGLERETAEGGGVGREGNREIVYLEGTTAEKGATRRGSLLLGPIFSMILRHGGASSGLSLRFLALQVRMVNVCCLMMTSSA